MDRVAAADVLIGPSTREGVKVTSSAQVAPTATVAQFDVTANCASETVAPVIVSAAVPVFVRLTLALGDVDPISRIPKSIAEGVTASAEVAVEANVAATLCDAFMDTLQIPVPLHAPLHPVKVDPAAGNAERLNVVPGE